VAKTDLAWLIMKAKLSLLAGMVLMALASGCVAIPPLINVQHAEKNGETNARLKAIEDRMERLERKLDAR
jgi:hypothetical protein